MLPTGKWTIFRNFASKLRDFRTEIAYCIDPPSTAFPEDAIFIDPVPVGRLEDYIPQGSLNWNHYQHSAQNI